MISFQAKEARMDDFVDSKVLVQSQDRALELAAGRIFPHLVGFLVAHGTRRKKENALILMAGDPDGITISGCRVGQKFTVQVWVRSKEVFTGFLDMDLAKVFVVAWQRGEWESEIFDDFKGHHQLTGVVLGRPAH